MSTTTTTRPRRLRTKPAYRRGHDSYMALVRGFPLRPILTETEYDAATDVLEKLVVRNPDGLDPGESDYVDVLSDLVEDYDRRHYPMPKDRRSPSQRLTSLLDSSGMTQAALGKVIGANQPMVSLVLAGKRQLTIDHIRHLSAYFKINAGYFL
ncbi:MAG: helix-turn-helix domain-containing protein [Tepidisphaeraceae bacterium]